MAVVMVPAQASFPHVVADRLAARFDGQTLAGSTVWLPTARAGHALAKLLAARGCAVLPSFRTLGLDEDAARQLGVFDDGAPVVHEAAALAKLAGMWQARRDGLDAVAAVRLAGEFLQLQARLVRYGVSWDAVAAAVPEHLAAHWKDYADDLQAVGVAFDDWLARCGARTPATASVAWLRRLAARYEAGLERPAVIAGITDATPAALAVMQAVAAADGGTVMLPATPLGEAMAARLGGAMERMEAEAAAVPTASYVEAETPWQEALAVAAAARLALAETNGPVAVVTVDRDVARHVQAALGAQGLYAKDSAQQPLAERMAGGLLAAMATAIAQPSATAMAAVCGHPLVSPLDSWPALAAALEQALWRGSAVREGWYGWQRRWKGLRWHDDKAVRTAAEVAAPAWAVVDGIWSGLDGRAKPLAAWLEDVQAAMDKLAPAWREADGGRTVADWLAKTARSDTLPLTAETAAAVVSQLLASVKVPQAAVTPRLYLWGPQELRMQPVETLILGGCNTGSWPPAVFDPWLSEGQLEMLGVPNNRHRATVAAENWQQAHTLAAKVVYTRSLQQGGEPTVMAPLLRQALAAADIKAMRAEGAMFLAHAQPVLTPRMVAPAAFVPDTAWPAAWSASMVEGLRTCPYRALGERVLGLAPLPPFNPLPDRRTLGLLMHRWLESLFASVHGLPAPLEPHRQGDAAAVEAHLLEGGAVLLADEPEALQRLWQSRYPVLAQDVAVRLATLVQQGGRVDAVETPLPARTLGDVTFRAKADRVDTTVAGAVVVDYKTGGVPKPAEMADGRKPQLPMEGWLLQSDRTKVVAAEVWKLRGYGPRPLEVARVDGDTWQEIISAVEDGLMAMVTRFGKSSDWPAWPDMKSGGLAASGHCEHCGLAGVCRFREWAA
ncbi:MAG: PD-(D/E)XK nuclease family protein [Pseudomonadaceae bacterium]|nr:PD-(D/E)XK nuclease family protein [Pseudomonadaceae bacterium]